ncbi:hypothetical protein HPB51_019758 [Rhipicephalus microplus]|uniref:Uncharacterized protein n=1 Tax=Rhipicephalus microplus TaxID=6941 RepID=A0A9J6F605_RHIMP|nr:hypothetical protein HPB51_019758 [Rhipicephalus microplus]
MKDRTLVVPQSVKHLTVLTSGRRPFAPALHSPLRTLASSVSGGARELPVAGTTLLIEDPVSRRSRNEPDTADTAGKEPDNATEEPDLPPSASSSGADVINDLRGCGAPIPDTVTVEDFANVSSAVSSCAELNDNDIIEQVLQPPNSGFDSDDDDAPCAPEPPHADLSRALAVLSSSYSDRITLAEIQADLRARKRECMQQRINDFFRPPVD